MDFDESRLYFSHQQLQTRTDDVSQGEQPSNVSPDESDVDIKAVRRHFREFLRKLLERISCLSLCFRLLIVVLVPVLKI